MSKRALDRRLLGGAVLGGRTGPGWGLPAVSKSADRGLIWPVLGGALLTTRRTRRAGAAAMASVAVTTAVAGAAAHAVGRNRPPRVVALLSRGSTRRPSSASFPSTHTANAWAFATATTMHLPRAAALGVPAALAISTARVAIGHHYPSDVLAGALLGATTGTVVGRWTRPARPANVSAPASPT